MRKALWLVLVVGAVMIAAPFALGLPAKASGGQAMIDDFEPLMDQANVDKTAAYYNDVFVPLGDVVPAMSEENIAKFETYLQGFGGMQTDAENLVPGLAAALGMTPEQVQQFFATQYPSMAQMLAALPQMREDFDGLLALMAANVAIFGQVPAGLEHYEPLVTTMQANVGNYDDVSSLPEFTMFTWFFVVPGVLLVGAAGFGLLSGHTRPIFAARGARVGGRHHGLPGAAH
jgi:hypothetical protein